MTNESRMMETTETPLLAGKTCLVSGASRGIGYETAAGLARLGAHVIIVSQNQERAREAQQRIQAEFGKDAARYYVADLSVQAQVNQLAQEILRDYSQLDVLINNVGGWFSKYHESADGIEMTFALNHLSYFLLTGRLLPLLQNSRSARIINVSSDAHHQANGIRFDDIQFQHKYRVFSAYAHSKLANVLFTYELARRLEGTDLTVNVLHPGFVKTQLYRHFGLMTSIVNLLADLFGKNAVEGAQTSIYLASSPEVAGITGKYFSDCKQQDSSHASYDVSQAKRLWELSEEKTGFTYSI
jgi:NAD(P)-dependent dehydrogenase (short-subunit alcohol dehydrogenase family)